MRIMYMQSLATFIILICAFYVEAPPPPPTPNPSYTNLPKGVVPRGGVVPHGAVVASHDEPVRKKKRPHPGPKPVSTRVAVTHGDSPPPSPYDVEMPSHGPDAGAGEQSPGYEDLPYYESPTHVYSSLKFPIPEYRNVAKKSGPNAYENPTHDIPVNPTRLLSGDHVGDQTKPPQPFPRPPETNPGPLIKKATEKKPALQLKTAKGRHFPRLPSLPKDVQKKAKPDVQYRERRYGSDRDYELVEGDTREPHRLTEQETMERRAGIVETPHEMRENPHFFSGIIRHGTM